MEIEERCADGCPDPDATHRALPKRESPAIAPLEQPALPALTAESQTLAWTGEWGPQMRDSALSYLVSADMC